MFSLWDKGSVSMISTRHSITQNIKSTYLYGNEPPPYAWLLPLWRSISSVTTDLLHTIISSKNTWNVRTCRFSCSYTIDHFEIFHVYLHRWSRWLIAVTRNISTTNVLLLNLCLDWIITIKKVIMNDINRFFLNNKSSLHKDMHFQRISLANGAEHD